MANSSDWSSDLQVVLGKVFDKKCVHRYFVDKEIFDGECFKILLSKSFGTLIIIGSLLVKIPQILKILSSKSVEGLNLFSVLLDLSAITCTVAYSFVSGFPFTSWGDGTFLGIQTAIIAALIIFYRGSHIRAVAFICIYISLCYTFMSGLVPVEYLRLMQALTVPILLTGKLSQAWTNFTNKSTGQISAITSCMLLAGSMARIFTSIQETNDSMMILTYSASTFANGVIVMQLLYYWNRSSTAKTVRKSGKAD